MKYKSHDFTTLLAKTEVTLEGKERRVSPHPIPLGPEDFFFFFFPTGFPLLHGSLLGESETKVQILENE